MDEYFKLKWKDHTSSFVAHLSEIYDQEKYCDITIVCHGKRYLVHRLVLALGSQFFEDIFAKVPSTDSVIIIDDIEPFHLEWVLNFIYYGSVSVRYDMICSFLRIAEFLHVRGVSYSPLVAKKEAMRKKCNPESVKGEYCDFIGFTCIENMEKDASYQMLRNLDLCKVTVKEDSWNNENKENESKDYIANAKFHSTGNFNHFTDATVTITNLHRLTENKLNPVVCLERLKSSELGTYADEDTSSSSSSDSDWEMNNNAVSHLSVASQHAVTTRGHRKSTSWSKDSQPLSSSSRGIHHFKTVSMEDNSTRVLNSLIRGEIKTNRFSLRKMKSCVYCPFQTKSLITLKKHVRNHQLEFSKPSYNEVSKREQQLKYCNAKQKMFRCSVCSFVSVSKMLVVKHQCMHHSNHKNHRSMTSSYTNKSFSKMKEHRLCPSKNKIYRCRLCPFTAKSELAVVQHKMSHNKSDILLCKICPYQATVKSQLDAHALHHIHDYPWKCQHCSYTANTLSAVSEHETIHTSHPMEDAKQAKSENTFLYNIKNQSSASNEEILKCRYCPFTATSQSVIIGHEAFHVSEEPFKCRFCPYKSAIKTMVKCHEMTHD